MNSMNPIIYEALRKNCARYKDKNLVRLATYAEQFKVAGELKRYMEVLL